jgi:hypothetical protein
MADFGFDGQEILVRFFKYIFEGLIVAVAAFMLPSKKMAYDEIAMIGLIAAATFAVLDLFAPAIGATARQGAGLGIGINLVGGLSSPGPYMR